MSTIDIDLRKGPAPGSGIERWDHPREEWSSHRDIGPSLPDDPGFTWAISGEPGRTIRVGGGGGAPDLLLRVAQRLAPTDERLAREVYLEALTLEICGDARSRFGVSAVCQAAQALPRVPESRRPTDLALDGLIKRFTKGYAAALPQLRAALDGFAAWDDMTDRERWSRLMSSIAMDLWDDRRWQDVATRRTAGGEEAGQATSEAAAGDANLGMVVSTEHRSLSSDAYAKAVICNGLGRYEQGRAAARWVVDRDDLGLSGWALSELVEASIRTGHDRLATEAFTRLRDQTGASGTDLALGIESRACALVTKGQAVEAHYRESVEYLGRAHVPIHLARSYLVYGEWLRRQGRRVDARLQLRGAEMIFDDMGSGAFADRTRRELLATGETVHKRTVAAYTELTPQEDEIARLASSRLTNSEIAVRLFISPRTVEWHLRKVFTKLGVTSRRELRFS
jgi:DNA-binding CsgD family transcriptional regulator